MGAIPTTLPCFQSSTLPSRETRQLRRCKVALKQNDSSDRLSGNEFDWKEFDIRKLTHREFTQLIHILSKNKMPDIAEKLLFESQVEGCVPSCNTLVALMLCYACNGHFLKSRAIWDEIINSSYVPDANTILSLMDAYGKMDRFSEIAQLVDELLTRHSDLSLEVYPLAINCFGKFGQLEMMEAAMKMMISSGFNVDSTTGNAFVRYYSIFGSLSEMEAAYFRLKRSRLLIEKEVIRAMALAYIRNRRFYELGEFLRDVGLGRKNCGNTLWNLLLLSYAANFKMKSLQREFFSMLSAGFSPDLTTFNIRSLAFSKMALFWDLHLSIEHMRHLEVNPDLVTYGCIVDAYVNKRLGKNLSFALNKMDSNNPPVILTDPIVFEVFGKGDFHSSSETLLEFKMQKQWTYSKLIQNYIKKVYRVNQIFWNY